LGERERERVHANAHRFDDLWYIWQREHGLRILAKDRLLNPRNINKTRILLDQVVELGSYIKRARAFAIGRTKDKPGVRARARAYDEEPMRLPRIRRAGAGRESEGDVERRDSDGDGREGSDGVSIISVPGSLVERLGGMEVGRRSSVDGELGVE
jgi:hypothetical protein